MLVDLSFMGVIIKYGLLAAINVSFECLIASSDKSHDLIEIAKAPTATTKAPAAIQFDID